MIKRILIERISNLIPIENSMVIEVKKAMTDYGLPLFLSLEDPLAVYCINNKLVLFNNYGGSVSTPYKAYNLLQEIIIHRKVESIFPKNLLSLLIKKKSIMNEDYFQQNLLGWKEPNNCYLCFNLELNKEDNKEKSVHLINLTFMEHKVKTEIQLSVKEALFTFANLSTNSFCTSYNAKYLISKKYTINEIIKKQIEMAINKKYTPKDVIELGEDFTRFAFTYIEFIRKELKENNITPQNVLNLSGTLVLVNTLDIPIVFSYLQNVCKQLIKIEKLSTNQLIVDYTLFMLAVGNVNQIYGPSIITETVRDYYEENKDHLDNLKNQLIKENPFSVERILKKLQK